MAWNPPRGGPAKGPGNGSKMKQFGKDIDPKAAAAKGVAAREIKRKWREAHPEWQAQPGMISKKELREYLSALTPDAIDKIQEIIENDKHPRQADILRMVVEQSLGRPSQAVELGGQDGQALTINLVKFAGDKPSE